MTRSRLTRRLAPLAGALALALPAAADPPGDWPRRAVGAGTLESASVRPDDRANRTRPSSYVPGTATTASAVEEGVDWGNVAGFSLFLAAIGLGGTAMIWSHRRDATAQRHE